MSNSTKKRVQQLTHILIAHIPNMISLSRLWALIPFYYAFQDNNIKLALWWICWMILSDILDGFFARCLKSVTNIGKLLDPLADKLAIPVVAFFVFSTTKVSLFVLFILVFRDFFLVSVAIIGILQKRVPLVKGSDVFGKMATFLIGHSFVFLLLSHIFHSSEWGVYFLELGKVLYYACLAPILITYYTYMKDIIRIFSAKIEPVEQKEKGMKK